MRTAQKLLQALLAASFLAACPVYAEMDDTYPKHSITMLCAWGPGGGSDAVARIVAEIMAEDLGQPVQVINQPGGGGNIAWASLQRAKPDGYTIAQITAELGMNHWQNPAIKTSYQDFEPLALVNLDAAAITVSAKAPYKTYEEFTAYIREHPAKVIASSTSLGGIWHLAMVKWLDALGLPYNTITWMSTSGTAEAMKEMTAGTVDAAFAQLSECAELYRSGDAVPLAVMASRRDPNYPDVPTLKELGINITIGTWRGFAVPRGTPQKVRERLNQSLKKAVNDPKFIAFMQDKGFGTAYLEGEEFLEFLKESDASLGQTIEALDLAR